MKLSELLEKTGLRLIGEGGGDADPAIEWVHTTELLDPSMYLTGGELILTTGLWRHRRSDAGRFISTLREAGISALGYGLPARGTEVPRDVQKACAENSLGLVEVPYDTPFIAISRVFVEWLTAKRQEWLVEALRRSETLTNSLRQGRGSEGILRILKRDLDLDAAVVTRTGETTAHPRGAGWPAELPELLGELRERKAFPMKAELGGVELAIFAVRAPGPDEAFLALATAPEAISDEQRTAIDQAVAFLAVELASRRAVRATELRFSGELLDLIADLPTRLPELRERLDGLGLDPGAPLAMLSVAAAGNGEEEPELTALERASRELGLRSAVIAGGGDHFMLVNADAEEVAPIARQVLELLEADRNVEAAGIGLGSVVPDAAELRATLSEARQARTLAAQRQEPYAIALATQAGSHDLLLALADRDIRATFAARLIEPLRSYDERRNSELVRTLAAFLDNACQWQRTAEEVNVHVNTLRHRLARIEALTGRDLTDMEARVDFFLALRADRMQA